MNIQQPEHTLTYGNIDANNSREIFYREVHNFLSSLSEEEQAKRLEILNSREEFESYVAFCGSGITTHEVCEVIGFLVGDVANLSNELESKYGIFLYGAMTHEVQKIVVNFHRNARIERALVWIPESIRDRVRSLLKALKIG